MLALGGHNDHPPMRYDDRYSNDGRGTPQRGMYDDNICRSENVLVNAPSRDHFSDGRHTPSVQGDGKDLHFMCMHLFYVNLLKN